jgi:hypothetical protein
VRYGRYGGHHKPYWTGSIAQIDQHRRDLFWLMGLVLGLIIPVATGVFIVFHLTCMRNPGSYMNNDGGMMEGIYMT